MIFFAWLFLGMGLLCLTCAMLLASGEAAKTDNFSDALGVAMLVSGAVWLLISGALFGLVSV